MAFQVHQVALSRGVGVFIGADGTGNIFRFDEVWMGSLSGYEGSMLWMLQGYGGLPVSGRHLYAMQASLVKAKRL